ncbi:hypothetical protein F5144DRAFT_23275 [Chaetomium tenue]|uniref:Uncharacterized protein n=1 Tax=Chaetomium tenue TaxID=1854479 RepID=A0ACB7PLS7_9PEZI|nr:hypothetical protein F5144DRAFT_23275 [Chaetomium globosum]
MLMSTATAVFTYRLPVPARSGTSGHLGHDSPFSPLPPLDGEREGAYNNPMAPLSTRQTDALGRGNNPKIWKKKKSEQGIDRFGPGDGPPFQEPRQIRTKSFVVPWLLAGFLSTGWNDNLAGPGRRFPCVRFYARGQPTGAFLVLSSDLSSHVCELLGQNDRHSGRADKFLHSQTGFRPGVCSPVELLGTLSAIHGSSTARNGGRAVLPCLPRSFEDTPSASRCHIAAGSSWG